MVEMICDICGYKDTAKLSTAVVVCKDGIVRCSLCQNQKRYGKKWITDNEPVIDHEGDTDTEATWPVPEIRSVEPLSDGGKPYNIR